MNVIGMQTLFVKEVRRFMRVSGQTVLSPLVSTTLYFLVFGYSLGRRIHEVHGVPYLLFIVPGLIFLGLANNAFLNTSSSLFITKLQGTFVDLLVAPLGPFEILAGFVAGGIVRGLTVGLLTWAIGAFFTGLKLAHPWVTILFLLLSSYGFSVLGLLASLWADKFEQLNIIPMFVMLPLSFLGGVFYSVNDLPEPWHFISLWNPMVYMVDGLRYGILDVKTVSPLIGAGILLGLASVSTALAYQGLKIGYKLKT